MAKTILQGTVKGTRRRGRQKKRWEDNIKEWMGMGFGDPWGQRKTGKVGGYCCNIICGAPTTTEVKGLRWDVMNIHCIDFSYKLDKRYFDLSSTLKVLGIGTEKSEQTVQTADSDHSAPQGEGAVWSASTLFAIPITSFGCIPAWQNHTIQMLWKWQHFFLVIPFLKNCYGMQ